jgi:hypothetical protein
MLEWKEMDKENNLPEWLELFPDHRIMFLPLLNKMMQQHLRRFGNVSKHGCSMLHEQGCRIWSRRIPKS